MLHLDANLDWGSARVSRVGEDVLAFANFPTFLHRKTKFADARRADQHARRVRYP
jgi:hypothetical protein